jgi:PKD domain
MDRGSVMRALKLLWDASVAARLAMSLPLMASGTMVSPVMFTADAAAPKVTLNSPASPSNNPTPSFTGTASNTTPVTVHIYAGAAAKGTVVSTATATGTGAAWASGNASPALSSGQYTAVATQANSLLGDSAGKSGPVTFTVTPPPVVTPAEAPQSTPAPVPMPTPPGASFKWFPRVPQTGELVSLVSTSTDAASPITGIAWALTSSGPFRGGGAVLTTSFSTPGGHVVRLLVTNANGLSSVVTETINVVGPTASLMQPFPVVRIAGTETASGVKLRLLKVQQMPAGARITVRCKGRGCPVRSARRVAASSRRGVAPVEFRRFERSLRFGVTLEVLVSKPGEIGKYTRFAIRRGKLPERVDMCLDLAGVKPLVCPSSAA